MPAILTVFHLTAVAVNCVMSRTVRKEEKKKRKEKKERKKERKEERMTDSVLKQNPNTLKG